MMVMMFLIKRGPKHVQFLPFRGLCLFSSVPPTTTTTCTEVLTSPVIQSPTGSDQLRSSDDKKDAFEIKIGLEVACKLPVTTKLFSRSQVDYFAQPNRNVSLLDASLPGTLRVVNRRCLELAIKSALALHCTINKVCSFDREHKFDPKSSSGYRIIQARQPIAHYGYINVPNYYNSKEGFYSKRVEVTSIHLEEDIGTITPNHLDQLDGIDLNSCGSPMLKFVFDPSDIKPRESSALIHELLTILKRVGATNKHLEERILSIDATIQIMKDSAPYDTVRLRSLNSHLAVGQALSNVIGHVKSILARYQTIYHKEYVNNPLNGSLRPTNTTNHDLRLMAEPSIPPFQLFESTDLPSPSLSLNTLTSEMPSLPDEERTILVQKYGLFSIQAHRLVINDLAQLFVQIIRAAETISVHFDSDRLYIFLMTVVEKALLQVDSDVKKLDSHIMNLVRCLGMLLERKIIRPIAIKMVCEWLNGNQGSPEELINSFGWSTIEDDSLITEICKKVIQERCSVAFLVKRGDTVFLSNLVRKVKVASKSRIPETVIQAKLTSLIDSIDRTDLARFVAARNKSTRVKPNLFPDKETIDNRDVE